MEKALLLYFLRDVFKKCSEMKAAAEAEKCCFLMPCEKESIISEETGEKVNSLSRSTKWVWWVDPASS